MDQRVLFGHQAQESFDRQSAARIEAQIQRKVDSGYAPLRGWLFCNLKFFFPTRQENRASDRGKNNAHPLGGVDDIRVTLARNTALFGGAQILNSLEVGAVTHVLIHTTQMSPASIMALRQSIALGSTSKIPHLVSLDWLEESWKHGTLLDEESKCTSYLIGCI